MRACLIPLLTEARNPAANWRQFLRRLPEAVRFQPDVICLPECTFTGYLYSEIDFQEFAEPAGGPTTAQIAVLAQEHRCAFCFGLLEKTDQGVYDSAVWINRSGKILHVHRKNLEHPPFLLGSDVQSFETGFGRAALLVCGDLFDEEVRAKMDRTARLVFLPMARSFDGPSPDPARWVREERQVYLDETAKLGITTVMVNALETTPAEAAFGGALAVGPGGQCLAESPHGTDEILVFDTGGL